MPIIIFALLSFGAGIFHSIYIGSWKDTWLANLGAIRMAKIELAEWPKEKLNDESTMEAFSDSERMFIKSLSHNPFNRTALHRLGLISSHRNDFTTAMTYFERAYQVDPGHRGIRKNLGFNYVWTGRYGEAHKLLNEIPEARWEMEVYAWWWGTQGRDDLANSSKEMLYLLK
jgi:tetratricopeptide (TPR) repeat protein